MKNNINSIIIALAIIVTAGIFSRAYNFRYHRSDTINVTGLGKKDFVSDLISWSGSFKRKSMDLKTAYAELNADRELLKKFILSKGSNEKEMVFSSVNIEREFESIRDEHGNVIKSIFTGFSLSQSVHIESNDIEKVENVSREVTEVINSGVEFSSFAPEYYYTKLAELKIEMIAAATKDAQIRATKIAENAGGKLGKMRNANMGVFQITAQNSSEEYSYGGAFNTSSKNKTAAITMKLEYESD